MTPEEIAAAIKKRSQLMVKLIAKQLGKTIKQVEEQLDKPGGFEELESEYEDHYSELETENVNKGYKSLKGQLTKALKKAGVTLPEDFKIDDALIEVVQTHFKGGDGTVNESDTIKELKQKLADANKALTDKEDEHKAEIEKITKEHSRKEQTSDITTFVGKLVKEFGGKIPTEEEKAAQKLQKMLKGEEILAGNWKYDEKKKDYVKVDDDGNPVREGTATVTLRSVISSNLEFYYDKVSAKPKDSGGLPTNKAGGGDDENGGGGNNAWSWKDYKGAIPQKPEDFDKIMDDFNQTPEAIAEVQRYKDTIFSKQNTPDSGGDDE